LVAERPAVVVSAVWRRVTRMRGSMAGTPAAAVLAMIPSGETITAEGVPGTR
jgi:hypothetical protein